MLVTGGSARRWLLAAVVIGALARLPGVVWGVNWPDGFTVHHPDEYTHIANADAIVTPLGPRTGVGYPKAMAAFAAAPYLFWYAMHGQFGGPRVHLPFIVGAGRLVSVSFGVAAIVLVFLIGRDALGDERSGVFAAWLLALGGLHVTQSHFFLADIPAATCLLLAVWLLWRDLTMSAPGDHEMLRWAAFAAAAAVAFKVAVFALPALLYAIVARPPRVLRGIHAAVFALAALLGCSLGFETPLTFYRALTTGTGNPVEFSRIRGALIYAVQLPSILTLPLLLLALLGTWMLMRRLSGVAPVRRRHALAVFASVPLVGLAFVLIKLDNFARHLVWLIPWAALAGGWALARLTERLARAGRSPAILVVPVFVWMAAFAVDGERYYILEPRNDALRWLRAHVAPGTTLNWMGRRTPAGYPTVRWHDEGEPDVLVFEMFEANQALSGVNWRDSYPSNAREVYDARSPERVAAIQSLFRGTSNYVEAARFRDRYVMPEFRLEAALLGDRARNYITEVVIFRRRAD